MQAFHLGQSMQRISHGHTPIRHYPQRAKHAINDHFHSYAMTKPLTNMAHIAHKKTLTLISGPLSDINVEKPREAQIST